MPATLAFCQADPGSRVSFAPNQSPQLEWGDLPLGTRSLALTCIDRDAPCSGDDVNQEGRYVSKDLARVDFVHWLIVDIPIDLSGLARGECGAGVTPGGKGTPPGPEQCRQGVNDYSGWFAGDAQMGGVYLGYDGPAPPWNDERIHCYCFELLALDVESIGLTEGFTRAAAEDAFAGHVIGSAQLTGTYTLNPDLIGSQ